MAMDQCARVFTGPTAAAMEVFVGGETTIMRESYHVFGDTESRNGQYTHSMALPGISVAAVRNRLLDPSAKHTTFSSRGNRFSRIAGLVQAGYTGAVSQASLKSHVRFRWNERDLLNYCENWKNFLRNDLEQTNAECEEQLRFVEMRFAHAGDSIASRYYTFLSDNQVEVMTGGELAEAKRRAREEKMRGQMINF